jgi:hypothetical protein
MSLGSDLFVVCAALGVFAYNLGTIEPLASAFPRRLEKIANRFMLSQRWDMYAPGPNTTHAWYVLRGILANGEVVDVQRNGGPIHWEKPRSIMPLYKNNRWRNFTSSIGQSEVATLLARYLCRQWNQPRGEAHRLDRLQLYRLSQPIRVDRGPSAVDRQILMDYRCPSEA